MWRAYLNQDLTMACGELHIWSVRINDHNDRLEKYWQLLNEQEIQKARAFKFIKDRRCFIIARGALRSLLGSYLHISPGGIEFKYGPYGKPCIQDTRMINFNISHSRNMILLGFVKKATIGIDIEYTKREVDVKKIAKHFFSKEEISSLAAIDEPYQLGAFYNCWTRKEAFIKALGSGLSFPLDQFVVSLDDASKARLIETKWDIYEKEKWTLQAIKPEEDYIGAVSVKGEINDVHYWKYQ